MPTSMCFPVPAIPRTTYAAVISPLTLWPVSSDADIHAPSLDQREHRLQKLEAAREAHRVPYRYPSDHTAAQVRAAHGELPPDTDTTDRVRMAGRLDLHPPAGRADLRGAA